MNFSAPLDRRAIKSIARRTLGLSEDDQHPISSIYLTHLKVFLQNYPGEYNFSIALGRGDGSITCRDCNCVIPPGSGEPEEDGKDIFGSLENYASHINSPEHSRNKTRSLGSTRAPASSPNASETTVTYPINSTTPRVVYDLTESPIMSHVSLSSSPGASSSSGPPYTLDSLYAINLDQEINGPKGQDSQSLDISRNNYATDSIPYNLDYADSILTTIPYETGNTTFSSTVNDPIPSGSSSTDNYLNGDGGIDSEEICRSGLIGILNDADDEDADSFLLYRTGHDNFQARCSLCHFSVELPAENILGERYTDLTHGLNAYKEHLKTPHHIRARTGSSQLSPASTQNTQPQPIYHTNQPNATEISIGKRKVPGGWTDDLDEELEYQIPYSNHGFTSASNMLHNRSWLGSLGMDYNNPGVRGQRPMITMPQRPRGPAFGQSSEDTEFPNTVPYINEEVTRFGSSDNENKFREFMNKALEEFKDNVPVAEAQSKLGLHSSDDLLPGMLVRLLPHQVIGVSWMLEQEKDVEKQGGILADAMGLGKTVQMIATMVMNRPASQVRDLEKDFLERFNMKNGKGKEKQRQKERRTTLIIAPASLLQQWYEEFREKTEGVFRVHIHHGKDKLKTVQEIECYDVIIASHQAVVMDFPKKPKKDSAHEEETDADNIPVTENKRLGPLARTPWLRVVIDEAQAIRNRATRISVNAAKLDSRYRWCLTGTPVTNSLTDIYAYIRFCRLAPWDAWKEFNNHIAKVQKKYPNRAGQRAQAVLRPHLLRRTKDSKLDGQPIIQLGPKIINMIELEFTQEELELYKSVEDKEKQKVSRFFREGSVMKNYHHILLMILRLRQLCCHPSLVVQRNVEDEYDADVFGQSEISTAIKVMGEEKVDEIKERFKQREVQRAKAERGLSEVEEDECAICMEPFTNNRMITACAHEFCSVCIIEVLRAAEGGEGEEEAAHCPLCRNIIAKEKVFSGKLFEPDPEEVDVILSVTPGYTDRPNKKAKVDDVDEADVKELEEETGELIEESTIEVSTKMRRMLESIKRWKEESPGDKMIIYSQWTSMLDMVERYLDQENIKTLRYDGRMNRVQRVDAVVQFKSQKGPSIMLISLKCGGVGLNLTVANRVINLDLAWNYATEAQAYDRVHRLGQHKDVTIERLIIKNTIEERIVKLQEKKQNLSDAALGEGTGGKLKRMTPREIAQLFDIRV